MSDERDLHAAEPASSEALVPSADPGAVPGADPARLPEADASLLALVDRLAVLLERSDLTELEVESGGTAILLRKAGPPAAAVPAAPASERASGAQRADPAGVPGGSGAGASGAASGAAPSGAATRADAPAAARSAVLAPLTGIYYTAPSPGSPPFVEVGREVAVGQVIGLIEAMKLFNEIKSDLAGRVVRVIPENGALVKAKHPLIEVEPL
jgi:acetyl-CoA carboxylase biotin carboxyl carrier protein